MEQSVLLMNNYSKSNSGHPGGFGDAESSSDDTGSGNRFFHHPRHWEFIAGQAVPHWRQNHQDSGVLRLWCADASTGEDAYSAAMLLHKLSGDEEFFRYSILATDLNEYVLEKAALACYRPGCLHSLESSYLRQYFIVDAASGFYRVSAAIRRTVRFTFCNLLNPPVCQPFDLVLLQGAALEGDLAKAKRVLRNIACRINRGGYLLLANEALLCACGDDFAQISAGVFQKR